MFHVVCVIYFTTFMEWSSQYLKHTFSLHLPLHRRYFESRQPLWLLDNTRAGENADTFYVDDIDGPRRRGEKIIVVEPLFLENQDDLYKLCTN